MSTAKVRPGQSHAAMPNRIPSPPRNTNTHQLRASVASMVVMAASSVRGGAAALGGAGRGLAEGGADPRLGVVRQGGPDDLAAVLLQLGQGLVRVGRPAAHQH